MQPEVGACRDQAPRQHRVWLGHEATASVGAYRALQDFSHPLSAFCNVQKALASLMKPRLLQTGWVLRVSSFSVALCVGNDGNFSYADFCPPLG